jgi:predicted transglutaminase-like cysteine proteinase
MRNLVGVALAVAMSVAMFSPIQAKLPDEDWVKIKVSFLETSGPSAAPFAHVRFCILEPAECRIRQGSVPEDLTEMWNQLDAVNTRVNAAIEARADGRASGDTWRLSPTTGDCEDYAITKRHALIEMGWPSAKLRLAVAVTARGVGHMVLVARTPLGDLVLDNRSPSVRSWEESDLSWRMIQSESNPKRWLEIGQP